MSKYQDKVIDGTQWGNIRVHMADDGKCEVFHLKNGKEQFLSFYDGVPTDSDDRIVAYIESKMF